MKWSDSRSESASRRSSPRLWLGDRFARGKSNLQVPPAQWTTRGDREDDTAERYTLAIWTNSHFDLRASQEWPPRLYAQLQNLTLARSLLHDVLDFGCRRFIFLLTHSNVSQRTRAFERKRKESYERPRL